MRRDYQRAFDYLSGIADRLARGLTKPMVIRLHDKAVERHGYRFGSSLKAVISLLYNWAEERGHVPANCNPAAGVKNVKRPKNRPPANRTWTDGERAAVLAAANPHEKAVLERIDRHWNQGIPFAAAM